MLIHALALAFAIQSLDAFDEANMAVTTCGFSAHRSAAEQNLSNDQFATKLSADCANQIGDMRRAIIAVEQSRGKSSSAAANSADSTIAAFKASFQRQYAQRAEDQRKLEQLKRAVEQERKSDAQ